MTRQGGQDGAQAPPASPALYHKRPWDASMEIISLVIDIMQLVLMAALAVMLYKDIKESKGE